MCNEEWYETGLLQDRDDSFDFYCCRNVALCRRRKLCCLLWFFIGEGTSGPSRNFYKTLQNGLNFGLNLVAMAMQSFRASTFCTSGSDRKLQMSC